jgi:hypothetical protein
MLALLSTPPWLSKFRDLIGLTDARTRLIGHSYHNGQNQYAEPRCHALVLGALRSSESVI